jgi:hypothetical protein
MGRPYQCRKWDFAEQGKPPRNTAMLLKRTNCDLSPRRAQVGAARWVSVAVIAVLVGAGVFLAGDPWMEPRPRQGAEVPGESADGTAAQQAATSSSQAGQANVATLAGERPGAAKSGGVVGTTAPVLPSTLVTGALRPQPAAPEFDLALAQSLVKFLAEFKPGKDKFTAEEIQAITDAIEELKRQGLAGVMAIDQFLQSGQDLNLKALIEGPNPAYSSLRLALIEALADIGGRDAGDAMVRTLAGTGNPQEIAVLARGLERYAPMLYRPEISDAVRATLTQALQSEPGKFGDLSYLFGVIQDYGDDSVAAELEEVYRTANNAWSEYALMTLSELPDGRGVPYLADMAKELAADPNRNDSRYTMSLRMLAQASRDSPEAATVLMGLAQAGKVPTPALVSVAATLGGSEYWLITPSSPLAQVSKAPAAVTTKAPEIWTNTEIEQRIGMIDQLLTYRPEPPAVQALNDARDRMLLWKSRPMVNGRRTK